MDVRRELEVDYSRVGRSTTFRTRLLRSEIDGLAVGDSILVTGDSVAPASAVLVAIDLDDLTVVLRLDGAGHHADDAQPDTTTDRANGVLR